MLLSRSTSAIWNWVLITAKWPSIGVAVIEPLAMPPNTFASATLSAVSAPPAMLALNAVRPSRDVPSLMAAADRRRQPGRRLQGRVRPHAARLGLRPASTRPRKSALCDGDECLDDVMLKNLDQRLAALPAERRSQAACVLVLHQMGSHGPSYAKRSAPDTKRFLPECTTNALAECSHSRTDERLRQLDRAHRPLPGADHRLAARRSRTQLRHRHALHERPRRVARRVRPVPAWSCRTTSRPRRRSTCRWWPGSAMA